jgi:hypothetical protein
MSRGAKVLERPGPFSCRFEISVDRILDWVQLDNDKARHSPRAGRAEPDLVDGLAANRVNAFAVTALSGFDLQAHLLA